MDGCGVVSRVKGYSSRLREVDDPSFRADDGPWTVASCFGDEWSTVSDGIGKLDISMSTYAARSWKFAYNFDDALLIGRFEARRLSLNVSISS